MAAHYQVGFDHLRQMVRKVGTAGGISARREPLKTGKNERKKREDGREKSQRLLLTWLVEQPKLFRTISAYLSPSDFTEGVYRKVAEELFRQMKEEGQPNPGPVSYTHLSRAFLHEKCRRWDLNPHDIAATGT